MDPNGTNTPIPQENKEKPKNKRLLVFIVIPIVFALTVAVLLYFLPRRDEAAYNDTKETPTAAVSNTPTPTPLVADTFGYDIKKPFELVPADMNDSGMGTGSGYNIILADKKYTVDELSKKITFTPETQFNVKKKSDNEYVLTPLTSLKPKQVYSIDFKDADNAVSYSWAFQTRDEFYVTATLPRDKATYVPVDTGIEITFSQRDMGDLTKYFEISPKTVGRFEIHKNVVAFVPAQKLSYDTVYTVTVKNGFSQKDGLTLADDTVFSFQTEPEPDPYSGGYDCLTFDFARDIYNLYSHETPAVSFYTNIDADAEVEFSLYKYDSGDEFKNDISVRDDRPYWCMDYIKPKNIDGKELVLMTKSVLEREKQEEDNYYYMSTGFLVLPNPIPEGYYIAVAKADGKERRAYIQINDMAVYVGTASNKTIGMIYDSATSMPVEGTEIAFDSFSMTTGADGIATSDKILLDDQSHGQRNYAIKRDGHPTYYSTVGYSYYRSYYYDDSYGYSERADINDLYWGYLFSDRSVYLPSDTVHLWGMLAGKDGNTAPRKLTVKLGFWSTEQPAIAEKEVELSGPDTFETEFSYENLSEGYYYINVESEGKTLLSRGFSVQTYQKPIYALETSLDKHVAAYGEKVNFSLTSKFFEGTPVNGMNFDYYIQGLSDNKSLSGKLKTDSNGQAGLEITAEKDTLSWQPVNVYVSVGNSDQEETHAASHENFTLFPRDIMIKTESETDESNNCQVNISTNKIDIDAVRSKEWFSEQDYMGAKADVDMTVELYEIYYTSTQTGTYYDFINKQSYPKYSYERHEKILNSFQTKSVDGVATFDFVKENNKGYYVKISCNDGNGRPILQTDYIYDYSYNSPSWRQQNYYSIKINQNDYTWSFGGEEAKASLYCNESQLVMPQNGKVLYMLFRKGLVGYTLSDQASFSFNLNKDYIPNIGVMAVYFDGRGMQSTYLETLHYDYTKSNLNINVIPSSNEYHPGDTAQFDIQVMDMAGNGRSAEVCISVVDEAYFALWDQSVNLLQSIYYQDVSLGYLGGSIPHSDTIYDQGYAEGGEGGEGGDEDSVRSEFKDTAYFGTVTTDSSGHAQVSVKLPDNLTNWRVTYQGVTDDLCAGSGKININTRLPYFINTVFSNQFITGDKPVIQLRSFGTLAVPGEDVIYIVKLEKDGKTIKEYDARGKVGDRTFVELDALEEGTYSYIVSGNDGPLKDAVKYDFEVLPGFIEQTRTDYTTLSENIAFPEVKWPATVYFFNTDVKQYWNELIDLSYSCGQRIDGIIVRKQARDILKEFFGQSWWYSSSEYDLKNYQIYDGGIALLPYDSSDPALTAKICSLGDSTFNYDKMKDYFHGVLSNEKSTSTGVAASYWGLACMREPILLDLKAYAAGPGLKLIDKLYAGLAYAYIGDLDSAAAIYNDAVAKYMKEDDLTAFISAKEEGYDSDDNQEATSLCALLAQKINATQCKKFFSYVSAMYGKDILTSAMRLTYIKSGIRNLNMESSFDYEIAGKKQSVTIKGIDTISIFLTSNMLKDIKFTNIKGSVTVATVYKGPIGELSETDPRLSITRKYVDKDGRELTAIGPSDYVKVVLKVHFDPTAPSGVYRVEDYLPASLKYTSANNSANEWVQEGNRRYWYFYNNYGPKVTFYLYHNNLGAEDRQIEYFARTVNLGEYTADSAAVFNLDSNITSYSPRQRVTVK